MSYVKHLVSKKKKRYIEDGFDLDLAYIKPNIVAMGFPSENLESVYRNDYDDVVRFLEAKHKDHYKVYNLCSERSYDPAKFSQRVSWFPFDDHNAPPFELIEPCCEDMGKWLGEDSSNVAIVHCKAGKGRTGVMICAYLLYKKFFDFAEDAMNYYAQARTSNDKGVTIPSQRRYITYYGYHLKNNLKYTPKTVLLNSITFVGIPTFNSGTCSPSFVVYQTKVELYRSKTYEVKRTDKEYTMELSKPLPICGDIKIDVFHKDFIKKERMFVFWFNTFFLEHGVTLNNPQGGGTFTIKKSSSGEKRIDYNLHKYELDKANKDKKHKFFPENFMVRVNITVLAEKKDMSKVQTLQTCNFPNDTVDGAKQTPYPKTLVTLANNSEKDKNKLLSLQRQKDNNPKPLDGGLLAPNCSNSTGPPSPNSKRLQLSNSSPNNPITPPLESIYDRNMSRSLEALRLEDEPLSDDDDEDDGGSQFPITRV